MIALEDGDTSYLHNAWQSCDLSFGELPTTLLCDLSEIDWINMPDHVIVT